MKSNVEVGNGAAKSLLNLHYIVTSHSGPGFNYGYQNSPFFEFDRARNASHPVDG